MRSVALKRLCTLITRGSAPAYSETDSGTAWAIGQSCQTIEGNFDPTRGRWHAGPVPSKGELRQGDVLINSTGAGTLGRVALVDCLPVGVPSFADGHVTVLRARHRSADPRFLAYVLGLPASREFLEAGLSVGATKQMELSVEALRAHHVEAPERAEQARIADWLDRMCARIDALHNELCEYERDVARPTIETFRRLVDGLPRGRIGYQFEVQLGKMLDEKRIDREDVSSYLRNANVHWDQLALEDVKQMTFTHAEKQKFCLQPGDLLVCEGGEPGRAAVWNGEIVDCYFQKALHRVRPLRNASVRYLLWCLRDLSDQGAFRGDGPGRYTHLTAEQLRAVRIPMPDAGTQARLADAVDAQAIAARGLERATSALARQIIEYRDALITEAVTGRLDSTRLSEALIDESLDAVRHRERPEVLAS